MSSSSSIRRLTGTLLLILLAPLANAEAVRVGIVFSDTSKTRFFDEFSYYQLYMAAQHQCAMAGIPFDLLDEDDLLDDANFAAYDALVIPDFSHVTAAKRATIVQELGQAAANTGLGIISAGWLMALDETGTPFADSGVPTENLLGVSWNSFRSGVQASLVATDTTHPALPGYAPNENFLSYNQIWFDVWGYSAAANQAASSAYCSFSTSGVSVPAADAITTSDGRRNVHFASFQVMEDTNLLWSAIQWVVHGDNTPVALRLGRERSIFFARNDMDQSMFNDEAPAVEVPFLDIITEWKDEHNFVGSYYLNVGNNPAQGEFTDWSFFSPLYHQYRALGNEIGSHSYTHPHHTSELNAAELEFEFNQSVLAIEQNMGIAVSGAAVPGNPETPAVIQTVAPWLDYLSGRSAIADSNFGITTAYGHPDPDLPLFYFCLNTSPDFTLIGFLGKTPAESAAVWQQEYANLHQHAPMPVIHWLWHDYGPTLAEPGFDRAMFDTMVATAAAGGSEFVTGHDLHQRVASLQASSLDITQIDANTFQAQITSANAGQFALQLPDGQPVTSVDNWFAYNDNKVFVPANGGTFTIRRNGTPSTATRIIALPQRAKLLSVTGDGSILDFSLEGEGKATVSLAPGASYQVTGADYMETDGSTVDLFFTAPGTHTCSIRILGANQPPVAGAVNATTKQSHPVVISLAGADPDDHTLTYSVGTPSNGTLRTKGPELVYTPNPGFSGTDSFQYIVSDGAESSAPATITITVTPLTIIADGDLSDWSAITPLATDPDDTSQAIDIRKLHALIENGTLYLALENESPVSNLNYGLTWYFDTDHNPNTGYSMFDIGADYILEGSTLLSFSGPTPSTWEWTFVATTTHSVAGTNVEYCFDLALIDGANSFDLIFWGNNTPYGGNAIDSVPNNPGSGAFLTYINPDSDGDGIPNDWETAHELNPLADDRTDDPDKDGCDNWCEYLADTDPQDEQSRQTLTAEPSPGTGVLRCRFQTSANRLYTVEYHNDLVTGPWRELLPPFMGDGTEMTVPDTPPGSQRFYRLRTTVP